ncbi:MAG: hypothetical protein HZA83_00980 [Thaumarchaeota archaeon]|nr:hypothetical protein [Nitrososphaerota archaeon]
MSKGVILNPEGLKDLMRSFSLLPLTSFRVLVRRMSSRRDEKTPRLLS